MFNRIVSLVLNKIYPRHIPSRNGAILTHGWSYTLLNSAICSSYDRLEEILFSYRSYGAIRVFIVVWKFLSGCSIYLIFCLLLYRIIVVVTNELMKKDMQITVAQRGWLFAINRIMEAATKNWQSRLKNHDHGMH